MPGMQARIGKVSANTVTRGANVLNIEDCLRQVMAIQGALGASLIDYPSGSTIGAAGRGPNGGTAHLVHATVDTAAFATIGEPGHVEDIVITAGNGYHVVHLLSSGIGRRLVLYLWLDRMLGNLAMTQMSIRSISEQLVNA